MMSLDMTEKKNKNRKIKSEVLAVLDSFDKEMPSNPGLFFSKEKTENNLSEEFSAFDEQLKERQLKPGQIVKGKILQLTEDQVLVGINYKSEGLIPRSEFSHFNKAEEEELKEGSMVDVYIEQMEDRNGVVVLSKDKANLKKVWKNIIRAQADDEVIPGRVLAVIKGGLTVDVGVKAFLPGSQLDIRPVKNPASFVGQILDFKILKLNQKRGNVVLSRKAVLEKDRVKITNNTDIKEGSIVKGIVKNITSYGAFIDLGDRDGLLYITDMSWSRIEHPSQLLKLGDALDLKVLKYDVEKNRISLGLKQLTEEKWEENILKYQVGQIVKGKVSTVVDYGIFVGLEEGVEGLVHVNELSWVKHNKPSLEMFKAGDELEVKIIDIKKASRKISLSVKQTQESPWLNLKEEYEAGQEGEFEVVSVSDFGLFVKVKDGVDGLIRAVDLSWTESIKPTDKYKAGDKVKAKVLDIDIESEKFSLGIKQLTKDPWDLLEDRFSIGSRHEVEVTKVVDFGAFVKLQDNIEGLIHISELSKKRVAKVEDVVKPGDKVLAEIVSIDKAAKKVGLSIRLVESNPSAGQSYDKAVPKSSIMENFFAKALKKSIRSEAEENRSEAKGNHSEDGENHSEAKQNTEETKKEDG